MQKSSIIFSLLIFSFISSICRSDMSSYTQELLERQKWWERNHPEYSLHNLPAPLVPPGTLLKSVTEIYAVDRTGTRDNALSREFLARGYFVLKALKEKTNMDLLSKEEMGSFIDALRLTRIEFVDRPLFDNKGIQVAAVTNAVPGSTQLKVIQVYKEDWNTSKRLHADLVRLVFHEYLRAIAKDDDNYVVSALLLVTEADFQARGYGNSECISGNLSKISISFSIAQNSASLNSPARVNGSIVARGKFDNFRNYWSVSLCTSTAYRFDTVIDGFAKRLYLYGGDSITLLVPSAQEYYSKMVPTGP